MALSMISANAPQSTDPAENDVSVASSQNVTIKLGSRVDDSEVFSNTLVTIAAFLGPWITNQNDHVINNKHNGEGLNEDIEKLDELLEHVKREVNGHIRETSRSSENCSGHPHLIRLLTSLVESMMAPGGHHDKISENGYVWLPETCAALRSLITHFEFEHVHEYGVSIDIIEKLKLKLLLWLEGPEGASDEDQEVVVPKHTFSEEEDVSHTFEQNDTEDLNEVDAGDHQEVEDEHKVKEMETEEDNPYYFLHPVLQTIPKKAKPTNFDKNLLHRGEYVPQTSHFNDVESSVCRIIAKYVKSKLPVEQDIDYVAVRKIFGGKICSVLPVVEFKETGNVDRKETKTDEFVCPTPPQLQAETLASIPVEVRKHIINFGVEKQDSEEDKKQERLLTDTMSMFSRDSNTLLPVLASSVTNDNLDSSLSSMPNSQESTSTSFLGFTGLLSTLPQQPRTPRRHKAKSRLYQQLSTPRPLPKIGFFDDYAPFSPLPTDDPFIEQEGFVPTPAFKRPRPRDNHGSSMLSRRAYCLETNPPIVNTTRPGQAPSGSPTKVRAKHRISGLGYTNRTNDLLHTFRSDNGNRIVNPDAGSNVSNVILLEDNE